MAILLGFVVLFFFQTKILCNALNNAEVLAFSKELSSGVNPMKYHDIHNIDFPAPKLSRASEPKPIMSHRNSMKYSNENSEMFPESGSRIARQEKLSDVELGQSNDFSGQSQYTPSYEELNHQMKTNQKSTDDNENNNLRKPRGYWDRRAGDAVYDTGDTQDATGANKDPWYLVNAYYHESGNSNYRPWKFHPKELMLPTSGTQSNINIPSRPGQGGRFRKWIIL